MYPRSQRAGIPREALFNSWDKNDAKDAQVILYLLKSGTTQVFSDPLECGNQDLQELLGTYRQVVDRKTRVYHSLQTHYLPLYFPEAEPFVTTARAEWFLNVLHDAPCPWFQPWMRPLPLRSFNEQRAEKGLFP